jgi:hypothetical protein
VSGGVELVPAETLVLHPYYVDGGNSAYIFLFVPLLMFILATLANRGNCYTG